MTGFELQTAWPTKPQPLPSTGFFVTISIEPTLGDLEYRILPKIGINRLANFLSSPGLKFLQQIRCLVCPINFRRQLLYLNVPIHSIFFLKMGNPGLNYHYFRSFQANIITNFTTNTCEKMSIQYIVPRFKPSTIGTQVSSHNH